MSVQFNVAIRAAAPGVTARIIASAPFDISRDRLPPRTRAPKYSDGKFLATNILFKKKWGREKKSINSGTSVTLNSLQQRKK